MSESDILDDELEHFGTKGMKWGVRKSKSQTGISRARGAIIDRNDRVIDKTERMQAGEMKIRAAAGRAFIGKKRQQKLWDKRITELDAENARLESGKLKVKDRLDVFGNAYVNTYSLWISSRPRDMAE